MMPSAGDIFCVYIDKLQRYAACQITHIKQSESGRGKPLFAVLELDWLGEKPPTMDELRDMKPLICNYFFWNGRTDHSYVDSGVPIGYMFVGNLPPLVTEEVKSYSGWHTGGSAWRQLEWETIPEDRRQRFKEAAKDDTSVDIGGRQVSRSASMVHEELLRELSDPSELEKLPCLTRIYADTLSAPLLAFIADNPFIIELQVKCFERTDLDLSACRLKHLTIGTEGLERLTLNPNMQQLTLIGLPSPQLHISAYEDGRWLTVKGKAQIPSFRGLVQLGALHLAEVPDLDLSAVIQRFPALQELRLSGKPGILTGLDRLAALPALRRFSTYDLFGFDGDEFPGPDKLPLLESLWMTSLPAEAAKSIKARYKKRAAAGLDLSITKARKPEWLAENLNNPFRDWDGREHITKANANKAASIYKKTLSALNTLDQRADGMAAEAVRKELDDLVRAYTEAFNKMDRRSNFIETVEREEIYVILLELLQNCNASGGEAEIHSYVELFNNLRNY